MLDQRDQIDWRNDNNQENGNKLRTYRLYNNRITTCHYVKCVRNRGHRRILSKFRSGSLPLAVETGRYARPKIPLEDRKCKYCKSNCVEDETHFFY